MKTSNSSKCPACGEWVLKERLSDHRLWTHNVGGAVGIQYFDQRSNHRLASYLNQIAGGHTYSA